MEKKESLPLVVLVVVRLDLVIKYRRVFQQSVDFKRHVRCMRVRARLNSVVIGFDKQTVNGISGYRLPCQANKLTFVCGAWTLDNRTD